MLASWQRLWKVRNGHEDDDNGNRVEGAGDGDDPRGRHRAAEAHERHDAASPGPATRSEYLRRRHATADFTEADSDDTSNNGVGLFRRESTARTVAAGYDEGDGEHGVDNEDGVGGHGSAVLPQFAGSYLGKL